MTRRHRTPCPVAAQSVTRAAPPDPVAAHTVVFTGRVHNNGVTRRVVLRAAGVAAVAAPVAGCSWLDDDPAPPPPPDHLAALVSETSALAGEYVKAMTVQPDLTERLTPIHQAHVAHLAELLRVTGAPPPSGTAIAVITPGDPADVLLAQLRSFESAARDNAVARCLSAPADRAVLAGTIAAARATHLEVLK